MTLTARLTQAARGGGTQLADVRPGSVMVEERGWQPTGTQLPPYTMVRAGARNGSGYDAAQAHGAVYACVDALCRLIVWQMPVSTIDPAGNTVPNPTVIDNPDPNPTMTGEHWRSAVTESVALRGFAAGIVTALEGPGGYPSRIMLLHPDQVTHERGRDGTVTWRIGNRAATLYQHGGDLWVAPGMRATPGRPVARSILAHARHTVELGLEAQEFGGDYFKAGGHPVGHAKVHTHATLEEWQADEIRGRIMTATANRMPLVTANNVEYGTLAVSADDSQFLATMQANVAMVAMFFGINAETIGGSSGGSLTYSTVEGQMLNLLVSTGGAWMRWWEVTLGQLTPPGYRCVLDPEALLRTSVPTLYDTAQKGVGRGGTPGLMTIDEGRALIGYPPLPDGKGAEVYVPTGFTPGPALDKPQT